MRTARLVTQDFVATSVSQSLKIITKPAILLPEFRMFVKNRLVLSTVADCCRNNVGSKVVLCNMD